MWGRFRRGGKTHKNIYGGNGLFVFIESSAMCQRVFLSLYVKRLRKKKKKTFYFCCNVLAALGTLKELGLSPALRGDNES